MISDKGPDYVWAPPSVPSLAERVKAWLEDVKYIRDILSDYDALMQELSILELENEILNRQLLVARGELDPSF